MELEVTLTKLGTAASQLEKGMNQAFSRMKMPEIGMNASSLSKFQGAVDDLDEALSGIENATGEMTKGQALSGIAKMGTGAKAETAGKGGPMDSLVSLGTKAVAALAVVAVVVGAVKDIIQPILDQVSMIIQLLVLPFAMILQSLIKPVMVLIIIAIRFWTKLFGGIFKIITSFVMFILRLFGVDTSKFDMGDLSGDFFKHMMTGLKVFDDIMNGVTDTITGFFDTKANKPTTGTAGDGLFGALQTISNPLDALFKMFFGTVEPEKDPTGWLFGKLFKVGETLMAPLTWLWGAIFKDGAQEADPPGTWLWKKIFSAIAPIADPAMWLYNLIFNPNGNKTTPNQNSGAGGGNQPPEKNIFTDAYDNLELVWGQGGIASQLMTKAGAYVLDPLFADGTGFFAKGGTLEKGFNTFGSLVEVLLFGDGLGFFAKGGFFETGLKTLATVAYDVLFSDKPESLKSKFLAGFTDMVSGLKGAIDLVKNFADAVRSLFNAIPREILNAFLPHVEDAIISPSGQIITTSPADYLIATKDPGSLTRGGGGNTFNINITNPTFNSDSDMDRLLDKLQRRMEQNLKRGGTYATGM